VFAGDVDGHEQRRVADAVDVLHPYDGVAI
jgi:hypothetical protein